MKYDVHLFAVVRVKVEEVEAENQKNAIRKAVRSIDLYRRFIGERTEYAEEVVRYVVDEIGDETHAHTRTYLDKHHLGCVAQDQKYGAEVIDFRKSKKPRSPREGTEGSTDERPHRINAARARRRDQRRSQTPRIT